MSFLASIKTTRNSNNDLQTELKNIRQTLKTETYHISQNPRVPFQELSQNMLIDTKLESEFRNKSGCLEAAYSKLPLKQQSKIEMESKSIVSNSPLSSKLNGISVSQMHANGLSFIPGQIYSEMEENIKNHSIQSQFEMKKSGGLNNELIEIQRGEIETFNKFQLDRIRVIDIQLIERKTQLYELDVCLHASRKEYERILEEINQQKDLSKSFRKELSSLQIEKASTQKELIKLNEQKQKEEQRVTVYKQMLKQMFEEELQLKASRQHQEAIINQMKEMIEQRNKDASTLSSQSTKNINSVNNEVIINQLQRELYEVKKQKECLNSQVTQLLDQQKTISSQKEEFIKREIDVKAKEISLARNILEIETLAKQVHSQKAKYEDILLSVNQTCNNCGIKAKLVKLQNNTTNIDATKSQISGDRYSIHFKQQEAEKFDQVIKHRMNQSLDSIGIQQKFYPDLREDINQNEFQQMELLKKSSQSFEIQRQKQMLSTLPCFIKQTFDQNKSSFHSSIDQKQSLSTQYNINSGISNPFLNSRIDASQVLNLTNQEANEYGIRMRYAAQKARSKSAAGFHSNNLIQKIYELKEISSGIEDQIKTEPSEIILLDSTSNPVHNQLDSILQLHSKKKNLSVSFKTFQKK